MGRRRARSVEAEDAPAAAPEAFAHEGVAAREQLEEDRRPQDRRSQIAAARDRTTAARRARADRARAARRTASSSAASSATPRRSRRRCATSSSENNLPSAGVRLGIANNRIGVRTFEIAGIDDQKQLANAIRFRAQEALPIPLDEAVLDYQVLDEATSEDGQPVSRVLLVVAYSELVDRYVDACRKAGLPLVGIDLEAFALLRALAAPHEPMQTPSAAALVAVSIGHDRSTFAVSDGRICEFTRVLEWGGRSLNVALARALDIEPPRSSRSSGHCRSTATTAPEGCRRGADRGGAARWSARQVQSFARELVSSLQYYQNQPGSLGIGEIVITGGTAHLPGLAEELERLIGVQSASAIRSRA